MTEENTGNFEEQSTEDTEAIANEAAEEKARQRFKVKIDDEELEVDQDEVVKGYQKAQASTKRFQEASRIKKEAEELREQMLQNPFAALSDKMDKKQLREMTEQWLLEQLNEDQLSPEQRRLRELEAKEKAWQEEREDRERKAAESKLQEDASRAAQEYEKQFVSALEARDLPKSFATIKKMAYHIRNAAQNNYELSVDEAADLVQDEVQNDIRDLVGKLNTEQILKILGKDVADKIRKHDVSKLKNPTSKAPQKSESSTGNKSKDQDKYLGSAGFKRLQEELRAGLKK